MLNDREPRFSARFLHHPFISLVGHFLLPTLRHINQIIEKEEALTLGLERAV